MKKTRVTLTINALNREEEQWLQNLLMDAMGEFQFARNCTEDAGLGAFYTPANSWKARAYVDKNYPEPSTAYPTEEARQKKALQVAGRCVLAEKLRNATVEVETPDECKGGLYCHCDNCGDIPF